MSELKIDSNPIGTAQPVEGVDNYVNSAIKQWEATTAEAKKEPWWKVWKSVSLEKMHLVTHFLLGSLDDLIGYLVNTNLSGADKKATVLAAVAILYDRTAGEALPTWLKPFSSGVKYYIISILVASAIDWICEKYKDGSWSNKADPEIQAMFLPGWLPGNSGGIGGIGSIGK